MNKLQGLIAPCFSILSLNDFSTPNTTLSYNLIKETIPELFEQAI